MLPLVSDQWTVAQEVLKREGLNVRPCGWAAPGHHKPACVVANGFGHHLLWRIWFHCGSTRTLSKLESTVIVALGTALLWKKQTNKQKKTLPLGISANKQHKKNLYYKKEKYAQDNGVYVSFFLLSGKSVWHNAYIFEGICIATRLEKVFRPETSLNACSSFWATPLSRGLWEMGRAQQRGHSLPPSLWWLRFTVFALRFSFTHTETHEDKEMPWTVGVSSVQNLLPLLCLNYSWYTQLA